MGSYRRISLRSVRSRDWMFVLASVCCFLVAATYFIACILIILKRNHEFGPWTWALHLLEGLIWVSLGLSLNIQGVGRRLRILILAWWTTFSVLASALYVEILVESHSLPALDIVSWPANVLLIVCCIKIIATSETNQKYQSAALRQPLLSEESAATSLLGQAGSFSRMTFSYINPVLKLGYNRPLRIEDVPELDYEDGVCPVYHEFSHQWEKLNREVNLNRNNLVLMALVNCYWREMLLIGVYSSLRALAVASAPLLLYAFVQYTYVEERDVLVGCLLVGCLGFVKAVESLSQRHWFFNSRRYGMRMRSAVMAAVFRKQLVLSSSGRRNHSAGEIVNYVAIDAYSLGESLWWFNLAVCLVLQLLLGVAVLFGVTGAGAILGLIPLILGGVLNLPFAKSLQNCQREVMAAEDERLRATSEILNSIKVIKLQSWEEKFRQVIDSLRETEFKWLAESQINKSYGSGLYWMSPVIVSSVVFAGCAISGSAPLNASTVFTVLATLRVMSEPAKMLAEVISRMIQVKVSLHRLNGFLLEDEIKQEVERSQENSNLSVSARGGAFSWSADSSSMTLQGINLVISKGEKIAVCGPVGAGKSSLLYALLGEIPKISGSVHVFGSLAYVSQTSWIRSGTIRDNILFEKAMDESRYKVAIKACALDKDIDNFDHGDLTEIGERGLNMSGGQKQRIQLARAVYSDADIYLLDDPFSAVDAHTAAHLFNECVMTTLRDKTVVLVTHQLEFLSETDKILVMEDGKISQSGTYSELLESGTAFERLVHAHQSSSTVLDSINRNKTSETMKQSDCKSSDKELEEFSSDKELEEEELATSPASEVQLTEDEKMETGSHGWKPYADYIRVSKALLLLSLVVICQSAFIAFQAMSTYWLAVSVRVSSMNDSVLIGVYAAISFLSAIFAFLRSWIAALMGLKASKAFFSRLMDSLFRAPMQFFDSTPVGRILTRTSMDMNVIDFKLPFSIGFTLVSAIEVVSTIVIMATATWQVLLVAIPVLLFAIKLQGYYLASARELIRINGTTKAPIMNYSAETSLGVVTIRAFVLTDKLVHKYFKLINTDAKLFFCANAAMEWILIRVEALQNLTILTAALSLIFLPYGTINPGIVGLSLSYALTLTTSQINETRWYCNLDNHIISVERIKQFMHIPAEPPAVISDTRLPSSWPSEGRIDFENLQIRYRSNAPMVLKGISCTIMAGSKVGVVGRTGSGKSTLIGALFRLVDPAGGRIVIDNVDICTIGLSDLRRKLSIIPQEATLFRGSIRSNLDPLGVHSDHEIWEVIEKCQLKAIIRNLPALLDSHVSDEGDNWSVGQRQLFCLGRVLLKRSKILVLDEATASIDSATDALIQRVIKDEFSDCTKITVAHRVPTVVDSDMVMVLSYGKLLEYGEPLILMNSNSAFSKLVVEYLSNNKRNSR